MFGSQALEVGIGLALILFVLSTATSMVVEVISRLFNKRSADLERVLGDMVGDPANLYDTSLFTTLASGAGRSWFGLGRSKKPSYVPARVFADGVVEFLQKTQAAIGDGAPDATLYDDLPEPLRTRVRSVVAEVGGDLTALRAGLESWFDVTMESLQGSYKRWAAIWLFVIGLGVAIAGNVSIYRVAESLWVDPAVREAVVAAADQTVADGSVAEEIESIDDAVSQLESLQLPVGWHQDLRDDWNDATFWGRTATAAGWVVTALLVMLGAPFWFDLLTRLVSLRAAGDKPPPAVADPGSATTAVRAATITSAAATVAATSTGLPGQGPPPFLEPQRPADVPLTTALTAGVGR